MEQSTFENAVNEDLKEVHRLFEIKLDSKTTVCFVGLMERLERSIKEAEGGAIWKAIEEGSLQRLVTQVCKKMKMGQPLEKIAEDLVREVSVIEPIYNMAGKCGPEYDPESVMGKLAEAVNNPAAGLMPHCLQRGL